MRRLSVHGLVTVACVLVSIVGYAQSAPAVNLAGTWTFDTWLSDNPQQVDAAIRADLNEQDAVDGGFEGGAFGRGSGRRGDSARREGSQRREHRPDAEDQRTIDTLTQSLRYPPLMLQIMQSEASVSIGDTDGEARTFQVNGKRESQTFDTTRTETTARWEGPQLVIDVDLRNGRTMTYTYSIVPTTRQLLLRVTLERAPNQPGPFEIKLVYDRASAR